MRLVQINDFKKYAQRNQWDDTFMGSADMRKFLENQYGELKEVMTFLKLSK